MSKEEKKEEKLNTEEIVEKETTDNVEVAEDNKEPTEAEVKKAKKKKKGGKNISAGNAYVKATFNNTMISVTDLSGNVIASGSAGSMGYSGSKKSTPYVAGLIAGSVATKAKNHGMNDINVYVKGIGSGRESAVRALQSSGLNIVSIKDVTPLPHNGCKRPRVRRV